MSGSLDLNDNFLVLSLYSSGSGAKDGCYCNSHHTIIYKKQAIDKIEHKLCNAVLKSGKRRGEACGGKIHDTDATCCKRHMPK